MTGLLLPGEDSRTKHTVVWDFVGTIWENKEDPGGDLTQVGLLASGVLMGLGGNNDEDDVSVEKSCSVLLCLSQKNVELC